MEDALKELSKKGTTTLGIVTKEGIVVAADKRATMGYLIAHKAVDKIFKVNDTLVMTTAGLVGDNQMLLRYLKGQLNLYELKKGSKPSVKASSTLLAHILYGNRFSPWPFYVQILLAGVDETGYHLYTLTPDGTSLEDNYISTGSGSVVVYGLLQEHFKKNMSLDEATKLGYRCIRTAMERDIGTGENVDLVQITKSGIKFLTPEQISKIK